MMTKYLTWDKEITGLLNDGFKPKIFKDNKRVYEISFIRKNQSGLKIEGISYIQGNFTQKQLSNILFILKNNG